MPMLPIRIAGLLILVGVNAPVVAQAPIVDTAMARRVIEAAARAAEERYVMPDTGRLIAAHLRERLRQGAYAQPLAVDRFADRLTADMQAVNGDRHLYVRTGAGGSPQMVRPGAAGDDPGLVAERRVNHNFDAAQRLAGNVGYFAASALSGRTEETYRALDAAMAFLARSDAMIIDLRTTRGGTPAMSDYLAGYFLGPNVRTLNSSIRSTNQLMERVTPTVQGQVRADVPLIILIGPGTASGGEDFAFLMRTLRRATLIGDRTAGAGRPTALYPAGDGFVVSVSGGRTWDPKTGAEWERKGIEPDIRATRDEGIGTAHQQAIDQVIARTTDSSYRRALEWTRNAVRARTTPVKVADAMLRQYEGAYDQRLVKFENGRLFYYRDRTRPPELLVPVSESSFALGESIAVEFISDGGRVTAMKVTPPVGPPSTFPRVP